MKPARREPYKGQHLTLNELAALAGCTYIVMYYRLRNGNTPEEAVAMGAAKPKSAPRKQWQGPTIQQPPRGPQLPPETPVEGASAAAAPLTQRTLPADPRYAVTVVPRVFGDLRPGEYLPSDTHLSKVYGAGR